jgi:membrane protein YdbS with pleckstrin-like domain
MVNVVTEKDLPIRFRLVVRAAVVGLACAAVLVCALYWRQRDRDGPDVARDLLPWNAALIAGALLVGIGGTIYRRRAFRYSAGEDALTVEQRLSYRGVVTVPYGQMVFVETRRRFLDQLFGLARVRIDYSGVPEQAAHAAHAPGLAMFAALQKNPSSVIDEPPRYAGADFWGWSREFGTHVDIDGLTVADADTLRRVLMDRRREHVHRDRFGSP